MNKKQKLKPCPFCGSKKIHFESFIIPLFSTFAICKKCCARASFEKTKDDARIAWNKRVNNE